jgi:hypothetical protein
MQERHCSPCWAGAAALALSLSTGCAEDLAVDQPAPVAESVVTEAGTAATFRTRVDASNSEAWRYFSFATGAEVTPADPTSSPDWDLAFQRFHILSNGGVSGSGGAAIAVVASQTLADLGAAPADGYLEDQADGDDDDSIAESAFSMGDGWYAYDSATNRLSPHPNVYVVRTGSGAFYKLAIVDYYDAAGTSGYPSFEWAGL